MFTYNDKTLLEVPGGGVAGVVPAVQDGPPHQAGHPDDVGGDGDVKHSSLAGSSHHSDWKRWIVLEHSIFFVRIDHLLIY